MLNYWCCSKTIIRVISGADCVSFTFAVASYPPSETSKGTFTVQLQSNTS